MSLEDLEEETCHTSTAGLKKEPQGACAGRRL